ncbi:laccase-12-like [Fagus crenata]
MPPLPAFNDTPTVTAFSKSFRSPRKVEVPTELDESLFFTIGLGLNKCPKHLKARRCQGPNGTRFTASMNNVSFVLPKNVSILQAYQQGIPGVFTTDFPANPPLQFDYTGNVSRSLWQPTPGTKGNTVAVPVNGWAVIRFVADNPGAWLMHCHLDVHINWGLAMVFFVENGIGELQSIQPPPLDLPLC